MSNKQTAALQQQLAAATKPVAEVVKGNPAEPTQITATSFAKQPGNAERIAETLEALRFFFPAGERHELLAITKARKTFGGIFDDLAKMAECALMLSDEGLAAYAGLNPIAKAATNTIVPGRAACDNDVLRRTRLFFDIDPVRPKDTLRDESREEGGVAAGETCAWVSAVAWLAGANIVRLGQRRVSAIPRRTADERQRLGETASTGGGCEARHARGTRRHKCERPRSGFSGAGDDKPQGQRHAGPALAAVQTTSERQRRRCVASVPSIFD